MMTVEVSFDKVVHRTDEAIAFDMGDADPQWIPINCIDMDNFDEDLNIVDVAAWFAERAGLV
jgi:hypothetical protein